MERKKIDNLTELFSGPEPKTSGDLQQLCKELRALHVNKSMDPFCMYLFGVVLKRLDLLDDARAVLVEAVALEPLHWGAWLELSMLVTDRAKVS